jgi:chitinase
MGKNGGKTVLLSAVPQFTFLDEWDDGVINRGLFDFVWVHFYNNLSVLMDQNFKIL